MGDFVTICLVLFLSVGAGLGRIAWQRERNARFTREWIDFLREDLELTRT